MTNRTFELRCWMAVTIGTMFSIGTSACVGCEQQKGEATQQLSDRSQPTRRLLPVRQFLQPPRMCLGGIREAGSFVYNALDGLVDGRVFATDDQYGRYSISVRENDDTVTLVAPTDFYYLPYMGISETTRIICSTVLKVIDNGPGPQGQVFAFNVGQSFPIECWVNRRGTTAWSRVTAADSASGEPKDAFWLFALLRGDTSDQWLVVYNRDAEYSANITQAAGRLAREHGYVNQVTVDSSGQGTVARALDPNGQPFEGPYIDLNTYGTQFAAGGPPPCEEGCGWVPYGLGFYDCSRGDPNPLTRGCPLSDDGQLQYCGEGGQCQLTTCTPKTYTQVCIARENPPAEPCGERSDGCGGKITCGICPNGWTCGATGEPDYCGRRPIPPTIVGLKNAYNDVNNQLCGTFYDAITGTTVVMPTVCNLGQSCQYNVCTPIDYGYGVGVPPCSCEADAGTYRCGYEDPDGGLEEAWDTRGGG